MREPGPGGVGKRSPEPDPTPVEDLGAFVALLGELRAWAGAPGPPPGFQKIEDIAARTPGVGPGRISKTTMHRVLTWQADLAGLREPGQFVDAYVRALGADPGPWLVTLDRLLTAPERVEPVPEPPAIRSRRIPILVTMSTVAALIVGLIGWQVSREAPVPHPSDVTGQVSVATGSGDLRLAVERGSDQPGAAAVVISGAGSDIPTWEFVAPYRDNDEFHQVRPADGLLMCLEVVGGSLEENARVQQWGCNGERHQYWAVLPDAAGTTAGIVNLHSGLCLSVAGAQPRAGMQLVQRVCDEQSLGQRWRTSVAEATLPVVEAESVSQVGVGPDPAEYPGGGEDRECDGGLDTRPPGFDAWSTIPFMVREADAARGQVGIGPGTAGAVHLMRANVAGDDGAAETFYWADGYVTFTPQQFRMALQWTTLPGPGGWHTCEYDFTLEHGQVRTVAVQRDTDGDGNKDVYFRVCMSYRSDGSETWMVDCTGRY